jgi:hypothetical protein
MARSGNASALKKPAMLRLGFNTLAEAYDCAVRILIDAPAACREE